MDVEAYIRSGSLEEYVLGSASEQERREVECLSSIYPEIREALSEIEVDMERFASAYAKKLPTTFKDRMLAEVKNHQQEPVMKVVDGTTSAAQPALSIDRATTISKDGVDVAKTKSNTWQYWAAAASVLLAFGAWQYVQNQDLENELLTAQNELEQAQNNINAGSQEIEGLESNLAEAFNPATKKVLLKSVKDDAEVNVSLFWNTETGKVQLDASLLPELSADLQYQLWVLKDGVPIDMGVLPKDANALMAASKSTSVGDAFAITIEPFGGKESPTLEQLVVIGNIV